MDNLSCCEIMNNVKKTCPSSSIEDILDKTRKLIFEKKMKEISLEGHTNVFWFLESLVKSDMTRNEIVDGLEKYLPGSSVNFYLDDAIEFIEDKFSTDKKAGCFLWKAAASKRRRDTSLQLSK